MTTRIKIDIKLSDLLPLFQQHQVRPYFCHAIAYTIRDELLKIKACAKYVKQQIKSASPCTDIKEITSWYYAFLSLERDDFAKSLSLQSVAYFNQWLVSLIPGYEYNRENDFFNERELRKIITDPYHKVTLETQNIVRILILEKILAIDPNAVISIDITV